MTYKQKVIIGDAVLIYMLREYTSSSPRYVGKTSRSLHLRMANHMQVAGRNPRLPVGRWLAKVKRSGGSVCIELLESVPVGQDWQLREKFWIAKYRAEGAALLNLTDGGEGLSGHVFSVDHKEKIAAALRTGRECFCLNCGSSFWGKKNQIENGDAKYCSKSCYQKSQIGKQKANPAFPLAAITAAAAARRAMNECKRGHQLSGDNLYQSPSGSRVCKECRKLHKSTHIEGKK